MVSHASSLRSAITPSIVGAGEGPGPVGPPARIRHRVGLQPPRTVRRRHDLRRRPARGVHVGGGEPVARQARRPPRCLRLRPALARRELASAAVPKAALAGRRDRPTIHGRYRRVRHWRGSRSRSGRRIEGFEEVHGRPPVDVGGRSHRALGPLPAPDSRGKPFSQGGHRGNRAVSQLLRSERWSSNAIGVSPGAAIRHGRPSSTNHPPRVSPDRVGPSRVFSAARGPPAADPAFLVGDDAGVRRTARSRQDRQEVVQTILCRSGGKVENGVTCSQRCQARLIVGSARPTSRRRRRARRRPSWSGAVCRSHGSGLIAPSTSRRCSTPPGCSTARCSPGRRAARSSPWSSCSAGCEIDEACALRWRAIDFHSDVIRVEQVGKTAGELPRGRPVPRAAPSPPRAPLPAALDAAQRLGVRHEHR